MSQFPDAVIVQPEARPGFIRQSGAGGFLLRLLPLLLLLLLLFGCGQCYYRSGTVITITFADAHSLKPGDGIRLRSMLVGEVKTITPTSDLQAISVEAVLVPQAQAIARQTSRFWIMRPQLDLEGARGLETVIGPSYIGVQPGSGTVCTTFVGLDQPPALNVIPPGTKGVILSTAQADGLKPGVPVTYRDIPVGIVDRLSLVRNATGIDVHVLIFPQYAPLIAPETIFCRASGARFSAGLLEGVQWSVSPVKSLLLSRICLFVPENPAPEVADNARFPLLESPPSGADQWRPSLALGEDALQMPMPASLPTIVPVTLPSSGFFPGRSVGMHGVGFDTGLLVPNTAQFSPDSAQVSGHQIDATSWRKIEGGFWFLPGQFGNVPMSTGKTGEQTQIRRQDLYILYDPARQPFFLPEELLTLSEDRKSTVLQSQLTIPETWNGVPVFDRKATLAGVLTRRPGHADWCVMPLPPNTKDD